MAKSTVESEGWRGQRGRPSGGALSLGSVSVPLPARRWAVGLLAVVTALVAVLASTQPAWACGGFFCTTTPVDQNAERIIFTQNGDGTVSAYVQIEFTGSAPDFSWILPLPEAIDAEAVQVPEDAMAAFTELEVATDPVFIPPDLPECVLREPIVVVERIVEFSAVEVFASGEVGPYGFDVVGSEDPDALVTWLRENSYQVTEAMEPLIDLYVEEQFVFLAMKLRPDKGAQDVEPVKVTYPSERPMIPLRLTAVAANPDMAVMVWIYADQQAKPVNYATMNIANDELTFRGRGQGNDYRRLMSTKADEYGGQAFITEYAAPTRELRVTHPLLQQLAQRFAYVTRLNTVISPEEMTVDPVFDYDPQLKDVSNVRDLRGMTGLYRCERDERRRADQMAARSDSSASSVGKTETVVAADSTDAKRETASPAEATGAGTSSVEKAETVVAADSTDAERESASPAETSGADASSAEKTETVVSADSTDDKRGDSSPSEASESGTSPVAMGDDVAGSPDGDDLSVGTLVLGIVAGSVGALLLVGTVYLGILLGRRRTG